MVLKLLITPFKQHQAREVFFQRSSQRMDTSTNHKIFNQKFESNHHGFYPIPGIIDRFRLRNNHLKLEYFKNSNKSSIQLKLDLLAGIIKITNTVVENSVKK